MRKARGCFIFFMIIIVIAAVIIFYFIGSNDRKIASDNSVKINYSEELASYKDNGIDYLFLGIDERENENKFEGRTDTMIIMHIGNNGKNALISIPRDTRVELEGHGINKINAAYVYGGVNMVVDEIYELTDIKIDKVMLANFSAFIKLVDALGGVTITVAEPLHDDKSGSDFDPGTHNFTGEQALAFSRCRATAKGDFDRMDRQKYLLAELFRQKANFSIIPQIPDILKILNEDTKSNFKTFDYIKVAFKMMINRDDFILLTLPGESATIDNVSYVIVDPDEAKIFLNENLG